MKAKDWIAKLQNVSLEGSFDERYSSFFQEFVEETNKLVADRTKTSKPESHFPAAEGAVREQKGKFLAICSKIGEIKEEMFDKVIQGLPDYQNWVAAEVKRKSELEKTKNDDKVDYRKRKPFQKR